MKARQYGIHALMDGFMFSSSLVSSIFAIFGRRAASDLTQSRNATPYRLREAFICSTKEWHVEPGGLPPIQISQSLGKVAYTVSRS